MDRYQLDVIKSYDTLSYTDKGWLVKVPRHHEAAYIRACIPLNACANFKSIDGTDIALLQRDDNYYYMHLHRDEIYIKLSDAFMESWTLNPYTTIMPRVIIEYSFETGSFKEYPCFRM